MEIRKITEARFQTEVTEADMPVLLYFYADWCDSCKAQLPVLEEAAEEACDVRFCRISIEEASELAQRWQVTHVPTMFILNGTQIFRKIEGFRPLEELLELLEL